MVDATLIVLSLLGIAVVAIIVAAVAGAFNSSRNNDVSKALAKKGDDWMEIQGHVCRKDTKSSHMKYPILSDRYRRYMQHIKVELEHFHTWAKKHNFLYYLVAGNLIGWKRRKGFIPWDDDVDVYMPVESSSRLIAMYGPLPTGGKAWQGRIIDGYEVSYCYFLQFFKFKYIKGKGGGLDIFVSLKTPEVSKTKSAFRKKVERLDGSFHITKHEQVEEVRYDGLLTYIPKKGITGYLNRRYPGWRSTVHHGQ